MHDTPEQPALDFFAGPRIEVRRSARRKRTATAYRDGDQIVVLLPQRLSRSAAAELTDDLVGKVLAREARAVERSSSDLAERATALSQRYLQPRLGHVPVPASITWVNNQRHRWGSCTIGDRTIRLSHRLRPMPEWVVDYVILHELAHLIHPDHSAEFWALLAGYSRVERARGYLEGYEAAGEGTSRDDDGD